MVSTDVDINEFAAWALREHDHRLTLYEAKYVESMISGTDLVTRSRSARKQMLQVLLMEYYETKNDQPDQQPGS